MIYIPVFLAGWLLIVWLIHMNNTMDSYGANVKLINACGEEYKLIALMYIGGKGCDIDLDISSRASRDIPELLEIRYQNSRYYIRNVDEENPIIVYGQDGEYTLKENEEYILYDEDEFMVQYEKVSMKYKFMWG